MKETIKVQVEQERVRSITCDCCKKKYKESDYLHTFATYEFQEFVSIRLHCGYGSVFGDGDLHDIRPLDNHRFILLQGKRVTTAGQKVHFDFIQSYHKVVSLFVGGEV